MKEKDEAWREGGRACEALLFTQLQADANVTRNFSGVECGEFGALKNEIHE